MLTETARVVAIETDAVWVETVRQSSCGSCAARSGCGHGMMNSVRAGVSQGVIKAFLPVDEPLSVKLHDTVVIALPERGFLRAAWMLYAMPLLLAVAAALAGEQLWTSVDLSQAARDLRVTISAMAGLGLGLVLLRVYSQKMGCDPDMQPRVTRVD